MHHLHGLNNAEYLHFIEWWYTLFTYQLSGQAEYEEICEGKNMALLIFHITKRPAGRASAGWEFVCLNSGCACLSLRKSLAKLMQQMSFFILVHSFSIIENKRHRLLIRDWLSKSHLIGKRIKPALKISSCFFLGLLGDVVFLSVTLERAARCSCSWGGHP